MKLAVLVCGATVFLSGTATPMPIGPRTWTVCANGCDFSLIQSALDNPVLNPGDTVLVKAGDYPEGLTLHTPFVRVVGQGARIPGGGITLTPAAIGGAIQGFAFGGDVIINAALASLSFNSFDHGTVRVFAPGVAIEHNVIVNAIPTALSVGILIEIAGTTDCVGRGAGRIVGNLIANYTQAIRVRGAHGLLVSGNRLSGPFGNGIGLEGSCLVGIGEGGAWVVSDNAITFSGPSRGIFNSVGISVTGVAVISSNVISGDGQTGTGATGVIFWNGFSGGSLIGNSISAFSGRGIWLRQIDVLPTPTAVSYPLVLEGNVVSVAGASALCDGIAVGANNYYDPPSESCP